jgi:hypothetical protein
MIKNEFRALSALRLLALCRFSTSFLPSVALLSCLTAIDRFFKSYRPDH